MTRFILHDNSDAIIRQLKNKTENALKEAGRFVEGEAKLRTPVDTGLLRGSIDSKVIGDKEVQVGTNVEYAVYVEKGTSKMRAQPFLTPAFENNISEIKRIFESYLRQVGV